MRRSTQKQFSVYILANDTNVAIYIGVTSDLKGRVFQHRERLVPGFTKRHDIDKLVYYEVHDSAESAISREKRLKGSSRARKNRLVNAFNPEWQDPYEQL